MQWIISVIGLAILFILAWGAHRPASSSYRDAPLEDELLPHLGTIAARAESRGNAAITVSSHTLRTLEATIGYFNRLPSGELSPASKWLSDNGRFLQEEAASLMVSVKGARKLPKSLAGEARIFEFAKELIGHTNADLRTSRLQDAVAAWQKVTPFTVDEMGALPIALRAALLHIICEMAEQCANEQQSQLAAQQVGRLLRQKHERAAIRLFTKYEHSPAFLERMITESRTQEDTGRTVWLDRYFNEHDLSPQKLAQSEHDHQTENCLWVSNAITSLRSVARMPWHRLLEDFSPLHSALSQDATYPSMDMESRSYYRQRIARISVQTNKPELSVCSAAFSLCQSAGEGDIRGHVGYYLLDNGQASLFLYLQAMNAANRMRFFLSEHACGIFRFGSWIGFAALIALAYWLGIMPVLWLPFAFVFLYAAQQCVLWLSRRLIKPHLVPRIRVESLDASDKTLIVCPTMLLSSDHALSMVKHLSVLHQANPDEHLHFMLLGDYQDSMTGTLSGDDEIVGTAAAAIAALQENTGHPFIYMQRQRAFNPHDHLFTSRERKRGSLETLLKLIVGREIEEIFTYASVDPKSLKGKYRYVITLDSDTILPPGSALRMIGAMLHPLQKRQELHGIMRGISVLQPRMEVAAHNVGSYLSLLMGGRGGTDPYNSLTTDYYHDAYHHGSFCGKGIIDPSGFLNATDDCIIPSAILSHDLLEGELSGCALASDITLYDGHPKNLKGFCYRLHRWTRGDWQLLPYLLPIFPASSQAKNTSLSAVSKHKIWQNIFRSLVQPMRLILLVYAAVAGSYWLFLAALLLPEMASLIPPTKTALASMLVRIAVLPCEAAMQTDAILRSLYRMLVTRRNLLQWTTAAKLSEPSGRPPMLFFYQSMIAAAAMLLIALLIPKSFIIGLLAAAYWASFPFVLPYLEQPYHRTQRITDYMREELTRLASSTYSFFQTAITEDDHALPPDNLQVEPNKGISHRTSPTNIGLYLMSLISAQKLGILPTDDMAESISDTISSIEKMPKWKGHIYNWHDTQTLAPMRPHFISSVDSGNFAVCLLACAQGIRVLMSELPVKHHDLAARIDAIVDHMDFSPLFDPDAELFYIGLHPEENAERHSHYDLLASEARLLSFVSIMLGQIPVRHWYRLGRSMAQTKHGQTLLSYTGTMFEYMMPLLFQPPVRGTLLYEACQNALREQQSYQKHGVFGVSESGYYAFDPNLYYQYRAFGIPSLALDTVKNQNVIAPYASVLSMPIDLKSAFSNLQKLKSLGMDSPMGLFEAADFEPDRIGDKVSFQVVRSHMAHHQGMIMCAICNALSDNYIANLFSQLPRAQAYRLLLEERPQRSKNIIKHPLKKTSNESTISPLHSQRTAVSLHFPIDAHVLHGAGTTLLVDAHGGGYMSRNGIMMTRFHESCHVPSGMRLYLRDSQSGSYWSVTDPKLNQTVSYETAQAVFSHERFSMQSTLRIFVNPLDGTVLHHLTLQNNSNMERMLEVCSYLEPTLTSQRDDAAHPSFQNLFIQTEKLHKYGVCAKRRVRKESDEVQSLWHMLSTDASLTVFHTHTDRTSFIGRGRTLYAPRVLDLPISAMADTIGDMIEPCLSLRGQFVLPANSKAQFVFATLLPSPQDTPAAFHERYAQPENAVRCYEPALTQGLVTARYLGLSSTMQASVSRLSGMLSYTGQPFQFRYAGQTNLPLRELWGLGISGDLPILLVECADTRELSLVKLLLKAHAYYRMSGLWIDLVMICKQPAGYDHPLHDALDDLAQTSHSHELIGKAGGIHLFDRENLSSELFGLLRATARAVFLTGQGSIDDQIKALSYSVKSKQEYVCKPSTAWKVALPAMDELLFDNGYGGFSKADGNYIITLPPGRQTPAPWCNPLCTEDFGTLAGESGPIFSYTGNSHSGRLTHWYNDSVMPRSDECFFIRDGTNKLLWSITRFPLGHGLPARITHAPGETIYETSGYGIYGRLHCFTDEESTLGIRVLHLKNEDKADRILHFYHTCTFAMGNHPSAVQLTTTQRMDGTIFAKNPDVDGEVCLCGIDPEATLTTTMSSGAFNGLWGIVPTALSSSDVLPCDAGNVAVLCFTLQLKPGESKTFTSVLGFGKTHEALLESLDSLRSDGATLRLHTVKQHWEQRLGIMRFDLPDTALSLMLNRWLPYQVQAARLMMRAGFYQAGGAYGFRDQLQDMLSQVHTAPHLVRQHLLLCAAHQFEEGDVQHWWHPPRYGVRTRISDDLLFLPFIASIYIQVTGDTSLLSESVPYLHDRPLDANEHDRLNSPEVSTIEEPFWQHCVRAIDHVFVGAHGLPLMGSGDWNDGMNNVGGENGESVWLGMFLCEVLRRFAPLCEPVTARRLSDRRLGLLHMIDRYAWDGAWYLRAWYSDGEKLGSASSSECRIDILPQSWAVLSGVSRDRSTLAMDHAWRMLYERDIGILKLFTPPFDGQESPGYIAGYIPGVRENGGQYSHAVPWAISALHQLGQDDKAWELARAMLPINHAITKQLSNRYRVEPYVMAADIYSNPYQRGRGGWTWYTGSASWYQYVMLEQLFGFQKIGNTLRFRPVVPADWDDFSITYLYGSSTYHLHASRECPFPIIDGEQVRDGKLILMDDGRIHEATFPIRG